MKRGAVAAAAFGLGVLSIAAAAALQPDLGAVQIALVGVLISVTSCLLGLACGLCAVFGPRALDSLLARAVEASALLPTSVALLLVLATHPGLVSVLLVLSAIRGLRIGRCVRGEVLRIQQLSMLEAARSLGADGPHQIRKHYLPALHELLALELGAGVVWCLSLAAAVGFMRSDLRLAGSGFVNASAGIQLLVAVGAILLGVGCLLLASPGRDQRRSVSPFSS